MFGMLPPFDLPPFLFELDPELLAPYTICLPASAATPPTKAAHATS